MPDKGYIFGESRKYIFFFKLVGRKKYVQSGIYEPYRPYSNGFVIYYATGHTLSPLRSLMVTPYISDEAGALTYCSYCMCSELAPVDNDSYCTNYGALIHLCHVAATETPIS